jgi:hypothetical protein
VGDVPGGSSTYGVCFGTLSWLIENGSYGDRDLTGLSTVMSLRFRDKTLPSTPWEVILYVDERADLGQRDGLSNIFLGRVGGTPVQNFATAIGSVLAVRPARIELDHTMNYQRVRVADRVNVRVSHAFESDLPVMCGIPGFHHPGQEVVTEVLQSNEPALSWDLQFTCGFATDFAYSSDQQ